ncbi:uncharacterized protein TNCV_3992041 [Trichonephila clavipes]|uniref:Uncharacterized protein n=1 Tax=Trichonephila clavipes TaxID=2585209 RepID=A0A8X6T038_TRICX|nr:uncharacterized protein TNCV_3992041 [Trichonephila clavipes]
MFECFGRQVAGRNYPPTNKNTLIHALTEEWDKMPQQLLDNVVQSMEVLGPVDPRDVIYTKTRLRTLSTNQSSRRPPHRKKCTHTANCFIGHHPGPSRTFTRALVSSRTIRTHLAEGQLGSRRELRVLPLMPTHRRPDWSGAAHEETGLQRNGSKSSLATRERENPDSLIVD